MLDPQLIAAKWYVGKLSGEEMPGIACQALESGHDGKCLLYLAGLTRPARRDITETVDGAMRELGVRAPIAKSDAALWMANRVAGKIIEGRIEPYGGACHIWLSYSPAAHELEHWSDLAIDYEVAVETGGIEKVKQQVIQAARSLLTGAK
ncbi:MAG: hypothetical protein WBR10_15975 [Candidatus Acidiferrum sp.]